MLFCSKRVCCFVTNYTEGCRSNRVCVLIYYIGKGYILTGHSERGVNFKMSNTLFRVSFASFVHESVHS